MSRVQQSTEDTVITSILNRLHLASLFLPLSFLLLSFSPSVSLPSLCLWLFFSWTSRSFSIWGCLSLSHTFFSFGFDSVVLSLFVIRSSSLVWSPSLSLSNMTLLPFEFIRPPSWSSPFYSLIARGHALGTSLFQVCVFLTEPQAHANKPWESNVLQSPALGLWYYVTPSRNQSL